jgi:sialate O-acetylesterase
MRLAILLALSLALTAAQLEADIRLPSIFGDHMVLQQKTPLRVWGWAAPGESVTVTLADQSAQATADADGRWRVNLPARAAGGPFDLAVHGHNTVTFHDVMVGEVWLCSGQSNMQWEVYRVQNFAEELAQANHPLIRLFNLPRASMAEPQTDVKAQWAVCTPTSVNMFSGIGYFFARELQETLQVPVGMINSSYTGSAAEAWTDRDSLNADPATKVLLTNFQAALDKFSSDFYQHHGDAMRAWLPAADAAHAAGQPIPPPPVDFQEMWSDPRGGYGYPTSFFNGMIAPLAPFAITGAIWNQGESNVGRDAQYRVLQPALVRGWRKVFENDNLAFIAVQMPNEGARQPQPGDSTWAALREAQEALLQLPRTGLSVTIDLGTGDMHPLNKQDFGHRLALIAEATVYGKPVVYSGPLFSALKIDGNQATVTFTHTEGGLRSHDGGPVKGFALCSADKKWVWATGTIAGETVVVTSDQVTAPVAVRYGWADNPEVNLENGAGLPARPFRTDGAQ